MNEKLPIIKDVPVGSEFAHVSSVHFDSEPPGIIVLEYTFHYRVSENDNKELKTKK